MRQNGYSFQSFWRFQDFLSVLIHRFKNLLIEIRKSINASNKKIFLFLFVNQVEEENKDRARGILCLDHVYDGAFCSRGVNSIRPVDLRFLTVKIVLYFKVEYVWVPFRFIVKIYLQ